MRPGDDLPDLLVKEKIEQVAPEGNESIRSGWFQLAGALQPDANQPLQGSKARPRNLDAAFQWSSG